MHSQLRPCALYSASASYPLGGLIGAPLRGQGVPFVLVQLTVLSLHLPFYNRRPAREEKGMTVLSQRDVVSGAVVARIRMLNDLLRASFTGGKVVLTVALRQNAGLGSLNTRSQNYLEHAGSTEVLWWAYQPSEEHPMKKLLLNTAIAGLLITAPAFAQNNQTTTSPSTSAPAANTTSPTGQTTTQSGDRSERRGERSERRERTTSEGRDRDDRRSERGERREHRGFRERMRDRWHHWRHHHRHHHWRHHDER